MRWTDLPLNPTHRVLRQFAVAWLIFFLALAARQYFAHHHHTAGIIVGAVSLIGILGLIKPAAVRWLFVGATVAAFPIGWVVTYVVLAAMFYLVLTPMAVWFRLRGRDELQLQAKENEASFWTERRDTPPPEKYLKQF